MSPHIIVRASRADQNQMLIQVIDNGPGVADQERIFDAFVTTKNNGMGIGLAVSRSIVEAYGGRLRAENNPSRGTTFSVALPLSSGQSNSTSSYSGQTDSNSRGRASGKVTQTTLRIGRRPMTTLQEFRSEVCGLVPTNPTGS